MAGRVEVCDLGADVDYDSASRLQEAIHVARCAGSRPDTLLLLEHAPIYTLGRSAKPENICWDNETLRQAGIARVSTSRGGDVTYHGPGQLVGYPIIHLGQRAMGVLDYITAVEEALIRALEQCGLPGTGRDARNRGVWIGNDKIAAIGIRVSHQVTAHGFALNINTRLAHYEGIVPCGLVDAGVTSLAHCLGHAVAMNVVKRHVTDAFADVFGYDEVVWIDKAQTWKIE